MRIPSRTRNAALLLAASLVPAVPLLVPRTVFATDWPSQVWAVDYFGEYFRNHLGFPSVIHTASAAGLPRPIFYGYLLFPVLGVLAGWISGCYVVKAAAAAVWIAQFFLIHRLLARATGNRWFAAATAIAAGWAIYPMTNLYSRGAVPEFFATAFLGLAVCAWFSALQSESRRERILFANGAVLGLVAAAGSHPITAVFGLPCFGWIVLASHDRSSPFPARWRILAAFVLLGVACLAPWVLAVSTVGRGLQISRFAPVTYFHRTLDAPLVRASPVPIPARYMTHLKDEGVGTSYLDSQISLPLALILAACGAALLKPSASVRLRAAVLMLGLAAIAAFALSVIPGSLDHFGRIGRSIQYAYRMVAFINLFLLAAILAFACHRPGAPDRLPSPSRAWLVPALGLAAIAAVLKVDRSLLLAARPPSPGLVRTSFESAQLLALPKGYVGADDYATPGAFPRLAPDLAARLLLLEPGSGPAFGTLEARAPEASGWAVTNVQAFAWNRLQSGSRTAPLAEWDHRLAVRSNGSEPISYAFAPDRTWSLLHAIARPLFLFWTAASAAGALVLGLQRRCVLAD